MGAVVVTSPGSSPGATSLCVGLAMAWQSWGLEPLLIEADPAGGVLGHRFGISGPQAQRTLLTFAVDTRRTFRSEAVAKNLNQLAGFEALLAPVDPARAHQAVSQSAGVVERHLAPTNRPIVIDVGRLLPDSPALRLAKAAHAAYVVLEPQADQVQGAIFQLGALRKLGLFPQLVLVGEKPFDPDDVARSTDAPIAAILPSSPKTAVALSGGKFKRGPFNRSPLWRSISALARPLAADLISINNGINNGTAPGLSNADEDADESSPPPPPPPPLVEGEAASLPPPPPPPPPPVDVWTPDDDDGKPDPETELETEPDVDVVDDDDDDVEDDSDTTFWVIDHTGVAE